MLGSVCWGDTIGVWVVFDLVLGLWALPTPLGDRNIYAYLLLIRTDPIIYLLNIRLQIAVAAKNSRPPRKSIGFAKRFLWARKSFGFKKWSSADAKSSLVSTALLALLDIFARNETGNAHNRQTTSEITTYRSSICTPTTKKRAF